MFCIKGQWAALRDGVYSSVCFVGPVSGVFLILHGSVMEMEPPPQPTQGNRHCKEGALIPCGYVRMRWHPQDKALPLPRLRREPRVATAGQTILGQALTHSCPCGSSAPEKWTCWPW